MNRKGISPIIASVLLVAVSLSVVAIFSGWAPNLAKTVTSDVSDATNDTLNCDQAAVQIESAFYNDTSNETIVNLQNTDNTDLPNLTVTAYDSNNLIINQNQLRLNNGEINDTTISNVNSEPSYIKASSIKCSSKVEDRLDDITQ